MYKIDYISSTFEVSAVDRAELICAMMRFRAELRVCAGHSRRLGNSVVEKRLLDFDEHLAADVNLLLAANELSATPDLFNGVARYV